MDQRVLEEIALARLARSDLTAERLTRHLLAAAAKKGADPEAAAAQIEALIERYRGAGLLDDRRYAETRSKKLHQKGTAPEMVRAKLEAEGAGDNAIDAAIVGLGEDAERQAAIAYARRRRLGPFRPVDRQRFREKDLAALARRGFAEEIALAVIDADQTAD